VCVDDVPGLHRLKASLTCPGCAAKNFAEPTVWLVEDVCSRTQRCERCGNSVTLQNTNLETTRGSSGESHIIQMATNLIQSHLISFNLI